MGSGASVIIGNRRLQIWVRAVHTETLSLLFELRGQPSLHGTGSDSSHTFSFPCNQYRVALHGTGMGNQLFAAPVGKRSLSGVVERLVSRELSLTKFGNK